VTGRRRFGTIALVVLVVSAAGAATGLSFAASPPGIVTAIGGTGGGSGDAVAQNPVSLAIAPSGGLEIGDGTLMVVRSLSRSGAERNVACSGAIATSGYGGDGGPAADAACDGPYGITVDRSGDLVVADNQNNRIRVAAAANGTLFGTPVTAGEITTIAGDGTWGYAGDDGPATSAQLAYPAGTALDRGDNLIICDSGNNVIRVVASSTGTFYGQPMTAGDIYTVAGDGTAGFAGDGTAATGAELDQPTGVAVDKAGNLVIADLGNNQVRVVAASTGTFYGRRMTTGDIYTVAGDGTAGFAGDGAAATGAELDMPEGVALDAQGDVVIADYGNNRVRLVAERTRTAFGLPVIAGDIYTVAGTGEAQFSGDGGPATGAALSAPRDVVVDRGGDIVVADSGNNRVRVIAASTGTAYGQSVSAGDIQTVAGTGALGGFSGDGGSAADAVFNLPTGVAADTAGDVAVADQNNNRARFVPVRSGTYFGQPMVGGSLYTVAGDGTAGTSADGTSGPDAKIDVPSGIAFDSAGNLLVAEFGGNRIRVVAHDTGTFYGRPMTAGAIYTIAGTGAIASTGDGGPASRAGINAPENLTVDGSGNVVFTEFYGNRIRAIAATSGTFYGFSMKAGRIYTIAGTGASGSTGDGGPATAATFQQPVGVAVDRFGNLVVGDYLNNEVRVVATATGTFYGIPMEVGNVYDLAGNGSRGSAGDGGPATAAQLSFPAGVTVDPTGNVIFADSANNVVRVVAAVSGNFFGQSMTAGDIYTIAGGGVTSCPAGIGAPMPGAAAALSIPLGVAFAAPDSLHISDTANNCVRDLTAGQEAPGPPRSVTATAGSGSATVHWLPPSANGGRPVTGYVVTTVGGGPTSHARAGSSSATLTGLTDGTSYAFTVTAVNVLGSSPASANSKKVTPQP
jgi:trimeric autotransporter adhesin